MSETLLFRADASVEMGSGHVMRCLALAQEWRRQNGKAHFVQAETVAAVQDRIEKEGFAQSLLKSSPATAEDAKQTIELALESNADWIVADGYNFDCDYYRLIKESGLRLLVLDDYRHAEFYCADLVLNQNLDAKASLYHHRDLNTRLLLGPRYALLRSEFSKWRIWQREIGTVARKILVTFGGSDSANATGRVVQALMQIPDIESVILSGGSNPNLAQLRSDIAGNPTIRIVADTSEVSKFMAWADIAVVAGGSTSWELAFMGLPSCSRAIAANQTGNVAELARKGVSVGLDKGTMENATELASVIQELLRNPIERERMSKVGRELVDGLGACRVLERLKGANIKLRPAAQEDCQWAWELANDLEIRKASFSTAPIKWEDHSRWFAKKVADPECCFYIAINGLGEAIGQVRFEPRRNEGVISVSLSGASRGKGFGSILIREGLERLWLDTTATIVHAYIKAENVASLRSFRTAGFADAGVSEFDGHSATHLVAERGEEWR